MGTHRMFTYLRLKEEIKRFSHLLHLFSNVTLLGRPSLTILHKIASTSHPVALEIPYSVLICLILLHSGISIADMLFIHLFIVSLPITTFLSLPEWPSPKKTNSTGAMSLFCSLQYPQHQGQCSVD